jgi:hypothetical protein
MRKINTAIAAVLLYNAFIIAAMLGAFWFFGNGWPALMVFLLANFKTDEH